MRIIILLSFLLYTVSTMAQHAPQEPDFKMIVRLWPKHHSDKQTMQDLLQALDRYPKFCDEVWFCTEDPVSYTLQEHQKSAVMMGEMAQKLRSRGITPSLQFICVGHPEADDTVNPHIHWGTMVGPGGEITHKQSCPRQTAFLKQMEDVLALYAEQVQPRGAWIDDDLRVTGHSPASACCYCDYCIGLFNTQYGYKYTRPLLVDDMAHNRDGGKLRAQWIRFTQESLAGVAAAAARGVHRVSPQTHMGLQHVNFHRFFLEGYNWNPIFDAMERETGLVPFSRPGHGNYTDHAPRTMLEKGLDLARQIRRLNPNITEIAPEIEGYLHTSNGKSAHGVCIETMYFLAMGATQMSYALICGNQEPMDWYADHYFKHLQRWHDFARDYVHFNWGTQPGGINPYISPGMYATGESPTEDALTWTTTNTGTYIYTLAPLGYPFCPDGEYPVALMLDTPGIDRMKDTELSNLLAENDVILDTPAWNALKTRGLLQNYHSVAAPTDELSDIPCYEEPGHHRAVIIPYDLPATGLSGAGQLQRLHAMDWASHHRLPAMLESRAQAALIPRVDAEGNLRSVALLNCTITEEDSYTLRLRLGNKQHPRRYIWKKNGQHDKRLKPRFDGSDVLLTIPMLEGWNFGWVAVEN